MRFFYSPTQKKHVIKREISYGRTHAHYDKSNRVDSILSALKKKGVIRFSRPELLPYHALTAVHDEDYLRFLESSTELKKGESICPYVFPCDNRLATYGPTLPKRAGYYCFDAGTSLMNNTWPAALGSASSAYAACRHTQQTGEPSYALCRPSGHHASRNMFGGYCYLNNAAIAAKYLTTFGKVMIIDFDYHHGNGTQSIFYDSPDVFYFSIHAHPKVEYPYFTGFEEEIGIDDGVNYNLNVPLMPMTDAKEYLKQLKRGIQKAFAIMDPDFLVLSAGFDIEQDDPIGHFHLTGDHFFQLGQFFNSLDKKTTILQEGGYLISQLGHNVSQFLDGFSKGK